MGLDGGTIISRTDVLRGSSWRLSQADGSRSTRGGSVSTSSVYQPPQVEQDVQRATSWTTCSISGQPLSHPIVACGLGSLYNKDAVLEFLLGRKGMAMFADEAAAHRFANQMRTAAGALDHLRSLKDVFEVQVTANDALASGSAARSGGSGARAASPAPYMCPVTQLPCGRLPFSALRGCGCVVSDRALMFTPSGTCPACEQPCQQRDVVPINGSKQHVQELRKRLAQEAAAGSKGSKRRRREGAGAAEGSAKALCDKAASGILALEDSAAVEPRRDIEAAAVEASEAIPDAAKAPTAGAVASSCSLR